MRTGAILVVIDQFRRWDPRGRVNPMEPFSVLVLVAVLQVAEASSHRVGVVWEAGGPGWPAVPGSGIFSGNDAGLEAPKRKGGADLWGAETRDGFVWAGSTHASRSSMSPGKGPRGGHAWHGFGGFWRAAGVLQARTRSSTQIINLRRAKGRSHVASAGAAALPPDRPFHIRILSKHRLF